MNTPPIKDTAAFQRFIEFLQQQKVKKENLLLIHDVDGDGLSSGRILQEGLQQLGVKVRYRFAAYDRTKLFGDFVLEFIQKRRIAAIFTTDLNLLATNYPAQKQLLQNKTFIVFDHHEAPLEVDPNIIYFHPLRTYGYPDPSQYCTTKLVYDLLSEFADLSELDWVAAIGIVSDSTYKTWKESVDATLKKLGLPVPEDPFNSRLQRVGNLLYYGLAMGKEAADKAIKTFFNAKSYQEALDGLQPYAVVEEEVNTLMKNWREYVEGRKEGKEQEKQDQVIADDVIFIKIESKYKINSLLSSRISYQYPHKTIVVGAPSRESGGNKEEDEFTFSLRRQDGKVNLPAILKELSRQLPGAVGGGHIPASGAKCKKQDYEQFKALFRKLHEKYSPPAEGSGHKEQKDQKESGREVTEDKRKRGRKKKES
ncbi:MAG: hypothetical protein AABX13_05360 [Nanoarchaeota archaeon]